MEISEEKLQDNLQTLNIDQTRDFSKNLTDLNKSLANNLNDYRSIMEHHDKLENLNSEIFYDTNESADKLDARMSNINEKNQNISNTFTIRYNKISILH
jgi:hypothetical protein